MQELFEKLLSIADMLDEKGYCREADLVTAILKNLIDEKLLNDVLATTYKISLEPGRYSGRRGPRFFHKLKGDHKKYIMFKQGNAFEVFFSRPNTRWGVFTKDYNDILLGEFIVSCISKVDRNFRKLLYNNIYLVGDLAKTSGFAERLEKELNDEIQHEFEVNIQIKQKK